MGAKQELDFTSLLDDLIAASADAGKADDGIFASPSLRVDMLAQIERLQSENLSLFAERMILEYGDNIIDQPAPGAASTADSAPDLQPALEDLFFLDPDSISKELGIKPKSRPEELDKARRAFALRYHPDRVPEQYRPRAALRMQIANMLIDEAKRRGR